MSIDVSYEVQVTSATSARSADPEWVTIDYVEPELAAIIPEREAYLRRFQDEFGRGLPVRMVRIETIEAVLAQLPREEAS